MPKELSSFKGSSFSVSRIENINLISESLKRMGLWYNEDKSDHKCSDSLSYSYIR